MNTFVVQVPDCRVARRKYWRSPLRAPHHTVSLHGIAGEIDLCGDGTLFLQDLPEFRRAVLEWIGKHHRGIIRWSSEPCPCGDPRGRCCCTPGMIARWERRRSQSIDLINGKDVREEDWLE